MTATDVDAIAVTTPDFSTRSMRSRLCSRASMCSARSPLHHHRGLRLHPACLEALGKALRWASHALHEHVPRDEEIADSGASARSSIVVRHFVGHGGNFYYHDWRNTREHYLSALRRVARYRHHHWFKAAIPAVSAFGSRDFFGGDRPNDLTCPECPDRDTCTEAHSTRACSARSAPRSTSKTTTNDHELKAA